MTEFAQPVKRTFSSGECPRFLGIRAGRLMNINELVLV